MKKLILGLLFCLLMLAPSAKAAYQPLCAGYERAGNCSQNPCSPAEQASVSCSAGPCLNAGNSPACQDAAAQTKKNDNPVIKILATATRLISLIAGFAAIILIIVSGLNMITSGGNTESVATARKRLTGSVVGLVIASLAWVLSSFVVNQIL